MRNFIRGTSAYIGSESRLRVIITLYFVDLLLPFMSFSRISPALIRKLLVAGTGATGAGIAYATYDFNGLPRELQSALLVARFSSFSDPKQVREAYRHLSRGEKDVPETVALQISAHPGSVDLLWGSSSRETLLSILNRIAVVSPSNACLILSRAPSVQDLFECVSQSRLSWPTILSVLAQYKPMRFGQGMRLDFERFLDACRDLESQIPPELILFFILSHSSSIPIDLMGQVVDAVVSVALRDLGKCKAIFLTVLESVFNKLSADDARRIIPVLIRCMGNGGTRQLAEMCIRLMHKFDGHVEVEQRSVNRVIETLEKAPAEELILLELLGVLLRGNQKLVIPDTLQQMLMREYFQPYTVESKRRLSLNLLRSPQLLYSTALALETLMGVTDYEMSVRKQVVDNIMNRPVFDSELYAFHEESAEGEESSTIDPNDIEAIVERIGILTDMMRHNWSSSDSTGPPPLASQASQLLMLASFSQLVKLLQDPSLKDNQILRVCANISTLGRTVPAETRRKFIDLATAEISKSIKRENLSVHALAELRRLEHNLRCLPIKSAPMLIDSLLPLGASTPTDSDVDIVFIHGLRGGLFTWRVFDIAFKDPTGIPPGAQESRKRNINLWPAECLSPHFPSARMLAFTFEAPLWYATHKQHYSEIDVKRNFEEMAISLRTALRDSGVGRNGKKVVFVSFSMGGLVVKRALVDDELLRSSTLGVVFFATPHLGSPIADYAYYAPLGNLLSPFVADLSRKSKQIASLHESFTSLCENIPVLSVCETAQTDLGAGVKAMVVPYESCAACKNSRVIAAGENIDHEDVPKIKPELMEKDPRVTALIEFLNSRIVTGDNQN